MAARRSRNGAGGASGADPDPNGGSQGGSNADPLVTGEGTPRIIQAWKQPGGIACVQPWIDARVAAGDIAIVVERDGSRNGSGDPANDTHYWGILQRRTVTLPDCKAATIGDWNGKTNPEDYASSSGPPIYTTSDAVLDAAKTAAESTAALVADTGVDATRIGIGLLLVFLVLHFGGADK